MDISSVRWIAAAMLVGFSAFTIYSSMTENFWRSCRTVLSLKWGRQAVCDLYIGLLLFVFLIYLNEGSFGIALLWLIPTLLLGNIVPLLYFVIYFDSIVGRF